MLSKVSLPPFSDLPIPSNIKAAYEFLGSKEILGKLALRLTYADEPQFFYYVCEYFLGKGKKNVSHGFGCSDYEEVATTRAIAEAIEYYCISSPQEGLFLRGKYNELKRSAVDPTRFIPFSPSHLSQKKYKKFIVTGDTQLNWLEGYSLTKRKKVLIPASLVYANYDFRRHGEPIIQVPISTGAACGPTLDFALYHGLCEIIERDAYMISFLQEMEKKLLIIERGDDLFEFKRRIERYNFEVFFLDNSLDSSVYSIACLLIDRTGSGPAVCAGLGGNLDLREAMKTAAIEAVRRQISNRGAFFSPEPPPMPRKFSFEWFIRKKQQVWSAPHMIRQAEKFIKNTRKAHYRNNVTSANMSDKEKLDILVDELNKLNCEVLFVNMTVPEVAKFGLQVVKVICPEMVPLWRDDRYPYLGTKRLYEVPKKYGYSVNSGLDKLDLISAHPF